MSKSYLDPKTVAPDAWKSWTKDTLTMIRRVGVFGLVGMPVLLLGLSMAIAMVVHGKPLLYFLSIFPSLAFGLFFMAISYRMMGRARRAESPSPIMDITAGIYDVLETPQWAGRNLKSALIVVGVIMGIMFTVLLMASMAVNEQAVEETSSRSQTLLDTAMGVTFHITVWMWAMRAGGLMGLSYFFQVRERVEGDIASKLETLGRHRNTSIGSASGLLLAVGFVAIFTSSMSGYLGYIIINLMTLFMAGINICAWHDIYDPDEGLTVKQKQHSLELSSVPV